MPDLWWHLAGPSGHVPGPQVLVGGFLPASAPILAPRAGSVRTASRGALGLGSADLLPCEAGPPGTVCSNVGASWPRSAARSPAGGFLPLDFPFPSTHSRPGTDSSGCWPPRLPSFQEKQRRDPGFCGPGSSPARRFCKRQACKFGGFSLPGRRSLGRSSQFQSVRKTQASLLSTAEASVTMATWASQPNSVCRLSCLHFEGTCCPLHWTPSAAPFRLRPPSPLCPTRLLAKSRNSLA